MTTKTNRTAYRKALANSCSILRNIAEAERLGYPQNVVNALREDLARSNAAVESLRGV